MAFLDVLDAARAVCAGVSGIESAYRLAPEVAPDALKLPAVIQEAGTITVDYLASQEVRVYGWPIHLLYQRGGDRQTEAAALLPLVEALLVAFRSQGQHGLPNLYELRPTEASKPDGIGFGTEVYLGVTLTMTAKEKIAADFS